ncbi:MAG: RNA 2',3'-cyclic phosphodiesterase [Spirochaetaceae bacterium]|jgi:2'-5' RNA ligase|nr:RNA 2',3'-cyclic phosphodiesterase [Spirochaetaceae bacterium]
MRIFAALPLPENCAEALGKRTSILRELNPLWRWTEESDIHLTLAFLGELDREGAGLVIKSAGEAAQGQKAVSAGCGALITLPHGRNANVLALQIDKGHNELAALAAKFEKALLANGQAAGYVFRKEKRRFKPHITLARRGPAPLRLPQTDTTDAVYALFDRLVVFCSELRRDGAVYTPLAEFCFDSV